ncbi:LysM peptidoglycan-binding domain-containing protein [Flavobacterium franklandianum]|uniref:glucosaminidase domain-containing protein n=1 Tax=Flavobacterium franklandianum TaxID=2594430 RepID=UPI001179DFF2|nr:glucosaminidase domain-containing protein [Flavobacterium franklandianum]TRX29362.1 LysM peptidoglycan-binding domain-containing protein [Flavobacterium franklandianum]
MTRIYALLIMVLFFVSCNTKKSVIQTTRNGSHSSVSQNKNNSSNKSQTIEASPRVKVTNELILNYIEKYKDVAQSNMMNYGIPASIVLGQALLESGYGVSSLCIQANNHFGIKCHNDWLGESVRYDDDSAGECFRKYNDSKDSFQDHAFFLTSRSRYSSLFKLDYKDYKGWAKGLKEAGYATDPQYPTKLISLIERYELYKYDIYINKKDIVRYANNRISNETERYVVSKGDTLYSISKKYNIPVEELKKLNNIFDNSISIGQSIIIK